MHPANTSATPTYCGDDDPAWFSVRWGAPLETVAVGADALPLGYGKIVPAMPGPPSTPVKSAMRPLAGGTVVDDGVQSIPRRAPAAPPTPMPPPPPRPPLPTPPPASIAAGWTQIWDRQTSPPLHAASVEQELPTAHGARATSLLQLCASGIPTVSTTAAPRNDLADFMAECTQQSRGQANRP